MRERSFGTLHRPTAKGHVTGTVLLRHVDAVPNHSDYTLSATSLNAGKLDALNRPERMKGIEPSLSAWESERFGYSVVKASIQMLSSSLACELGNTHAYF